MGKVRKYPIGPVTETAPAVIQEENYLDNAKWLNTKEAAKYMRTSEPALRMRVRRRQLFPYRPFAGRRMLFKRSDLDRAIESPRNGV